MVWGQLGMGQHHVGVKNGALMSFNQHFYGDFNGIWTGFSQPGYVNSLLLKMAQSK